MANEAQIIEATQGVVLETVNGVANVIEATAQEIGHHGSIYETAEFWVAMAFVMTIALLAKPIVKIVKSMLNNRIDAIAKRIHDAANLKDDAQKMLVEYEKKFINAEREADIILKKSEKEVEFIKNQSLEKLEKEMKIKQKEAELRIKSAEEEALRQISSLASSVAIKAVKAAIIKNIDDETQNRLIDESIDLINQSL